MKKTLLSMLLAAVLCVTACGCGDSGSQSKTGHYDFFRGDGYYKLVYNGEIMDAEIESGYPTSNFYYRTASADMNTIAFDSLGTVCSTLYAANNGKVTEITDSCSMASETVSLDGRYILYLATDEDGENWSVEIYDCKEDKNTTIIDKLPPCPLHSNHVSTWTTYQFSPNGKFAAISVSSLASDKAGIYIYDIGKDELTKIVDLNEENDDEKFWYQNIAAVSDDGKNIVTYGDGANRVYKDGKEKKKFTSYDCLVVNTACTQLITLDDGDLVFYDIANNDRKKLKISSDGDSRLSPLSTAAQGFKGSISNSGYFNTVNSDSLFDAFYTTSSDIIYIDTDGKCETLTEDNKDSTRNNYLYRIVCQSTNTVFYTDKENILYCFTAGDDEPTEIGEVSSFGFTEDGKTCYYTTPDGELYAFDGKDSEYIYSDVCESSYRNGLSWIGEPSAIIDNSILYYNTSEECYFLYDGKNITELDLSDYWFIQNQYVIGGGRMEYQLSYSQNYNIYARHKDYLFMTDEDGNAHLLNAKGEITELS